MAPVPSMSTLRSSPMLFSTSSPSLSSASGFYLLMIACPLSKVPFIPLLWPLADFRSSVPSIGGFWSEGLGKEGTIQVGDDDEGA